jgi:leucyl-tRNA synthetase
LHVKRLEGYGFAIIESMARGRPVFLFDPLTADKSYLQWSELGTTAFSFSNGQSYEDQAKKILNDEEYRHKVQENCAKRIRSLVDNEEQNEKLKIFLENLR